MNRVRYFLIILGTIIVTWFIIVLIRRPEVLQDFWLWIVGLAGVIAAPIKNLYDILKEKLENRTQGAPQIKASGSEADLQKRLSGLELDLKQEREFYLREIKTLKQKISEMDEEDTDVSWEDLFEEEEEKEIESGPSPPAWQLNKEEILTFIQSLTRKERRKLIRDGKLPGD